MNILLIYILVNYSEVVISVNRIRMYVGWPNLNIEGKITIQERSKRQVCAMIHPERKIIDEIVDLEWEMFQAVNAGGPRASCQEDRKTFEHMRTAQFSAWSAQTAASYLDDLRSARGTGRNLVREKYIHMMRETDSDPYERLKGDLVFPDAQGLTFVDEITAVLARQTKKMFERYPLVCAAGRPRTSEGDDAFDTSVETYQRGELLTYSRRTLECYKQQLSEMEAEGSSLAEAIMARTVGYYGYGSLDEAESAMRERRRRG